MNCPKGKRSHTGVPRRAAHLHIASPQGQFLIFYSQLLLRIRKKHRFRGAFSLSIKSIYRFYFSCGSTHKIEFAQQIHKFREHGPDHPLLPLCGNSPCVSRNLYKGRKNVPVGRGFSSVFARKRGFEREAARKTIVFRQPHKRRLLSFTVFFPCNRNDK